jgi:O-antigen ligase
LPALISGSVLKPAGITSIFDVDVTVISVAIVVLAAAGRLLEKPSYPIADMAPVWLFAAVVMVGVMRSYPGEYQNFKATTFFFLPGTLIVCIPLLLRDRRDLRGFWCTWLLAGASAAVATFLVGGSDTLYGREGIGEATLGPAYLAASGLVAAVVGWGEGFARLYVALPAALTMGIAVVGIGSRGPFLSALAGVATWLLIRRARRFRSVLAILILGGAVAVGFSRASARSADRLLTYEDAARGDLWSLARLAFTESPVWGLGWGDYAGYVSWSKYPHNLFLEVAAELGLVGLLALSGVLITGALGVWRSRGLAEARAVGAIAVVSLVGQQFSSDLTNRVFWIALVPTLLLSRLRPEPPSQARLERGPKPRDSIDRPRG